MQLAEKLGMTVRAVPIGSIDPDWIGSSPGEAVFVGGVCYVEAHDRDDDAEMRYAASVLLHEVAHFAVALALGRTGDNYGLDDDMCYAHDDESLTCSMQLVWLIEHHEHPEEPSLCARWTNIHEWPRADRQHALEVWRMVLPGIVLDEERAYAWQLDSGDPLVAPW